MLGEEYVECNAIVNGLKDGNYYAAETDEQLNQEVVVVLYFLMEKL